jgi:hypothetical protein
MMAGLSIAPRPSWAGGPGLWAGTPTAFAMRLSAGRERWAGCAIDTLGIAAMLGEAVHLHARCHHCEAPLDLDATPDGPDPRGKACTAL